MPAHQEFLSLVAELAVAMAGFTGIVAVFRFRGSGSDSGKMINFITMLRASLSALLLSLLPYLLFVILDDAELMWRIGNLAVVLVMGANQYIFFTRGGVATSSRLGRWVLFPGGALVLLANLLALLQLLYADEAFIVAVSWMLLVSTHNFASLILTDDPPPEAG